METQREQSHLPLLCKILGHNSWPSSVFLLTSTPRPQPGPDPSSGPSAPPSPTSPGSFLCKNSRCSLRCVSPLRFPLGLPSSSNLPIYPQSKLSQAAAVPRWYTNSLPPCPPMGGCDVHPWSIRTAPFRKSSRSWPLPLLPRFPQKPPVATHLSQPVPVSQPPPCLSSFDRPPTRRRPAPLAPLSLCCPTLLPSQLPLLVSFAPHSTLNG